jgi:hypothetical protein
VPANAYPSDPASMKRYSTSSHGSDVNIYSMLQCRLLLQGLKDINQNKRNRASPKMLRLGLEPITTWLIPCDISHEALSKHLEMFPNFGNTRNMGLHAHHHHTTRLKGNMDWCAHMVADVNTHPGRNS